MSDHPAIISCTYYGKKSYFIVKGPNPDTNTFDYRIAPNKESATIFYNDKDLFDAYQDAKQIFPFAAIGLELLYPHKTPPDPNKKLHPVTPKQLDLN